MHSPPPFLYSPPMEGFQTRKRTKLEKENYVLNLCFSFLSDSKESTCNVEDLGSIPGLARSPEGNGYPLQYSGLENSIVRGAWKATVHGVTKSQT